MKLTTQSYQGLIEMYTSHDKFINFFQLKQILIKYLIWSQVLYLGLIVQICNEFYKFVEEIYENIETDWQTIRRPTLCLSRIQTIVANSIIDVEVIALISACEEANWIRNLLHEIHFGNTQFTCVDLLWKRKYIGRVHNHYYNG